MDESNVIILAVMVCMIAFSGFFSATETAFTSVNKIRIKKLAKEGSRRAAKVYELTEDYDSLLTTILIGNNIVNIVLTALATVLFIRLYGDIGATISTIVITVAILIFGEISPKSLAKEGAERFSMFAAPTISFFMVVFTPLNGVFRGWKRLLAKLFKIKGKKNYSEGELITIVEEAETEGTLESDQSELIQNAIEFNDLNAQEVMTPRVDIVAMDIDSDEEAAAELFRSTGFSRIPVYEEDMDSIQGVLYQKDFHNYVLGRENGISDFIKPVVFVAETMKISSLLKKLQALKAQMAIVVDEYGGTEGLVTVEDIVEELVGEIYDEHDAIMSQEVTELQNGSYRILGNASLGKVFDFLGVKRDLEVNTVNGWVVLCLDRLPVKGDTFSVRYDNKLLEGRVTKATAKKALEINLKLTETEEYEDREEENTWE